MTKTEKYPARGSQKILRLLLYLKIMRMLRTFSTMRCLRRFLSRHRIFPTIILRKFRFCGLRNRAI